jgi:hypothetical protein
MMAFTEMAIATAARTTFQQSNQFMVAPPFSG